MNCEQVQAQLHTYFWGQLLPSEQESMDAHLSTCQVCSEEAAAMKELGEKLSSGLKEWVSCGTCPSEVTKRIEKEIRTRRVKPWWRSWQVLTGVGAVAVVLLAVIVSTNPVLSHQVAALPLVGHIAALLTDDSDMRVDEVLAVEKNGITVTLEEVKRADSHTSLRYRIQGTVLDREADMATFAATLSGPTGSVSIQEMQMVWESGEVRVEARCAPLPTNVTWTLTLPALPIKSDGRAQLEQGPWVLTFET